MWFVASRCNPWHHKHCKNIGSVIQIVSQRIGWPRKKLSRVSISRCQQDPKGWICDFRENGKSSCSHCGRRLIGPPTEWDCWCNHKNPSPEPQTKRSSKANRRGVSWQPPQQQQQPKQPQQSNGKCESRPTEWLSAQSLDHAWPAEEEAAQDEPVSTMLLELGESMDPPWTVVCPKTKRRKRP